MRICISGSREFSKTTTPDPHVRGRFNVSYPGMVLVEWTIVQVSIFDPHVVIIVGGATGVDTWAADAARACGLLVEEMPADWRTHGVAAGHIRNQQMLDVSDIVIAFLDSASKGGSKETRGMIEIAKAAGKLRSVYAPDGTVETFKRNVRL